MEKGNLYFIRDEYFDDFPEGALSENRESCGGLTHGRPFFFAFQDNDTGVFWMIPISSKVAKYREIYDRKMERNGKCDTIVFGEVLGREKAFLIQNMCPISEYYVREEYCNKGVPVRLDRKTEKEITAKAKKILKLTRKGIKILFTNVLAIEETLLDRTHSG